METDQETRSSDWETPDLVRGTRVVIQSMPAPLSGRFGVIEDYDAAMHAYVVHVDGGNPRQIYRENLRIAPFDEITGEQLGFPAPVLKKVRRTNTRTKRDDAPADAPTERNYISAGDQLLLAVESDQFTLVELQGIRRLTRTEPHAFALSLAIDDSEVPRWVQKAQRKGKPQLGFKAGEAVYAQYSDGRFHPAKIKADLRDKFLVEWLGLEDGKERPIKKSLVCKRTSFSQLKNKPSFLGALAVAAGEQSKPGKRGRKRKNVEEDEEEENQEKRSDAPSVDEEDEEEEDGLGDYASSSSSGVDIECNRSVWKSQILPVLRLLRSSGITGFVDQSRKETFLLTGTATEDSFYDWLTDGAKKADKQPEVAGHEGFMWAAEVSSHAKNKSKMYEVKEI